LALLHGRARRRGILIALVLLLVCMCLPFAASAHTVLKHGMRGESVRELQDILNILGFLDEGSDGVFGDRTRQAVIAFQKANGLTVDGIVGADTWSLLEAEMARPRLETYIVNQGDTLYDLARLLGVSVDELAAINNISNPALIRVGQELLIPVTGIASRGKPGAAEMLHWDTANRIFKVGSIVTVIDVRTGLTFRVRRRGGSLHADVEPYTKEDTAMMKRICGGSWTWNRRPIIVQVSGRRIAASMNGMPHGGQTITDNNFNGHFCIHFLGSKLHNSGKSCSQHQACVKEAAAS